LTSLWARHISLSRAAAADDFLGLGLADLERQCRRCRCPFLASFRILNLRLRRRSRVHSSRTSTPSLFRPLLPLFFFLSLSLSISLPTSVHFTSLYVRELLGVLSRRPSVRPRPSPSLFALTTDQGYRLADLSLSISLSLWPYLLPLFSLTLSNLHDSLHGLDVLHNAPHCPSLSLARTLLPSASSACPSLLLAIFAARPGLQLVYLTMTGLAALSLKCSSSVLLVHSICFGSFGRLQDGAEGLLL
jgi:hypothetical protein